MKIARVFAHRVELPLHEGKYRWSGGKSVSVFDSTIIGVETDSGFTGYGEVCPLGPSYLPAYAEGVRAGLRELAPHVIGEDPRELAKLNHRMDAALKGHPYVKSGIDMACWDILGLATGLPVCTLMGGRFGESVRLYRAISQESPDAMAKKVAGYRADGYTRFANTLAIFILSLPHDRRLLASPSNSVRTGDCSAPTRPARISARA